MSDKDTINVYWAPYFGSPNVDWSILFSKPESLLSELLINKNINAKDKRNNFFSCPSFKDLIKNTYVIKNTIESEYSYNFSNNNQIIDPLSKTYLGYILEREPSLISGPSIRFEVSYIFFSEEPLLTTFTSPYFSHSPYMESGSFIPGQFDIGNWFRPYTCELQLWKDSGNIKFKHNEPLAYVKFNTDKKINFIKFNMNQKLYSIINTNINVRRVYQTKNMLSSYYYLFNRSKMKDMVLSEIKKEIVGN